jgi:chromate transporter
MNSEHHWKDILSVSGLFLKLGTISFGGPAAHISLMEQEVVHKRGWMDRAHFLDILAATNLVPGPNATEMAIYIGYVRAGWAGFVAAGIAFITPAFLISLLLSWIYVTYGTLAAGQSLFYGINPLVVAIILGATYRLGTTAWKGRTQIMLGVVAFLLALLNVNEVIIFLITGIFGILLYAPPGWLKKIPHAAFLPPVLLYLHSTLTKIPSWLDDRLFQLGLFFLKVGSLLFGSGMMLFAFIESDVVNRFGWLTHQQLMDAIAVGQMTPGPVLSSATFIGYLVSGFPGAVVATLAVFLPSFLIMLVLKSILPRLRNSATAAGFLKGINAAVVALILAVSLTIIRSAIVDVWTVLLLIAGLVALLRFKLDTFWLILGGALAGMVHYWLV